MEYDISLFISYLNDQGNYTATTENVSKGRMLYNEF